MGAIMPYLCKLSRYTSRAGEMIPEVEGTRPWGPSRKRVPKCLRGPKTTYITIAVAEKQSKRSKKGSFSLYIGPPGSHPGNEIIGARRGRSLPVLPPPRFLQPCIREAYKGRYIFAHRIGF